MELQSSPNSATSTPRSPSKLTSSHQFYLGGRPDIPGHNKDTEYKMADRRAVTRSPPRAPMASWRAECKSTSTRYDSWSKAIGNCTLFTTSLSTSSPAGRLGLTFTYC
ncbi:hypothetical protein J6590_011255 [Homalodisca vitripennis]|nr:hypothetical protein J6590_011255 [Homalodisca vitripennis]